MNLKGSWKEAHVDQNKFKEDHLFLFYLNTILSFFKHLVVVQRHLEVELVDIISGIIYGILIDGIDALSTIRY